MATLVDLVKISSASTGPGAITLGIAVPGYRGTEALTNGVVYSYAIQQGSNWEYGRATYLAAGPQLIRSPLASSAGGVALDLQPNAAVAIVALVEDFADLLGQTALVQAVRDAGDAAVAAATAAGVEQVDAIEAARVAALAAISGNVAAAAASAASAGAAASTAVAAAVVPINDYLTVFAKRFEGYGPGSFVAGQADWVRTMRDRLTSYFFDTRSGDVSFDATQPYKAKANGDSTFTAQKNNPSSYLFRNGQQHPFRAISNAANGQFPQFGYNNALPIPQCLGNFGAGATVPFLLETRKQISETWTNISGDIWEATIPIETMTFGGSGAAPSVASPRPTFWRKTDTTSESIGTRYQWVTGGANAAANNTALAALSGVGVTVRAPNGSGSETAGEVRSTGAVLSSVVVRAKVPSGVNPNTDRSFWIVDRQASAAFVGGWHGSFILPPGAGKDTVSYGALPTVSFGAPKEIPWGEEVTVYGSGHSGVGCMNTTGKYSGIGIAVEGDPLFAQGRTAGYAIHRYIPGIDLRGQYLYNQSLYAANAQTSISMHGSGVVGEGYRGWIIPDDITIINCGSGIEPYLLVEGFFHYGRLDITQTDGTAVLNPNLPYVRVAAKGGRFVAGGPGQTVFTKFGLPAGLVLDIGSDNLAEPVYLDATAINTGSPVFASATLVGSLDNGTAGAVNVLILRNVRDKLGPAGAAANKSYRLDGGSFFVNANKIWLDLRAGTDLQNTFITNVVDLTTVPQRLPVRLSWASGVKWGIGNHTFAEIEAAYAALGRTCTIASGAIAVNIAGNIIDTKA